MDQGDTVPEEEALVLLVSGPGLAPSKVERWS